MDNLNLLLKKYNFRFNKKYGQNFLSDGKILGDIIEKGGVTKDIPVLEIGCGAGTLTKELCKNAKYVYGYEIDRTLAPILGENLAGIENCDITFKDIMREPVESVEKRIGEEYMLVANLPYYITSPLIMKFVEGSENCKSIVIMVQDEVALRLCAKEGTADYGAITLGVNLVADSRRILSVSRDNFYPIPNVDSAVVRIDFNRNKYKGVDRKIYRDTVRAAFSSRRKTLVNNLSMWLNRPKTEIEEVLDKSNIDILVRGETLSSDDFVLLSQNIKETFIK